MESSAKTMSASSMQHGGHGAAVFDHQELILAEADGVESLEPGDPTRGGLGLILLLRHDQTQRGDQQDGGEEVGDTFEAGEQFEATGDEEAAHQDGSGNAPEEDLGLACAIDAEELE
jgi:hypothetical protein